MKIELSSQSRSYRLAFLILTIAGALMLVAATVFEYTFPGQTAAFSGFPLGAVVCLFVASLLYSKYLGFRRSDGIEPVIRSEGKKSEG